MTTPCRSSLTPEDFVAGLIGDGEGSDEEAVAAFVSAVTARDAAVRAEALREAMTVVIVGTAQTEETVLVVLELQRRAALADEVSRG